MTIYAVGDIHGARCKLAKALAYLRATLRGGDYAVFLGDYIDRGEDSRGVIDDLIAFAAEQPKTVFLRGNHEEWMLNCRRGGRCQDWLNCGGLKTLQSYGVLPGRQVRRWQEAIPESHLAFFSGLKTDHRAGNLWFAHAGVVPDPDRPGSWVPDLWVREEFIYDSSDFGRLVVFGHTPQILPYVPLVMPNKVCLDTGAAFGGPLTVAGFDESLDYRREVAFSIYQGLATGSLASRCLPHAAPFVRKAASAARHALEEAG